MRQRVQDVVRIGDKLFSDRYPIMTLWQVQAENFHVMRADFTRQRYISEEFGSFLMTSMPALCHRELQDAFSTMLRPRGQQWFHAKTDSENVNNDRDAKVWLDWASRTQRNAMYDARANFVRASKEGDGDFIAFGNAAITREIVDYEHFLYQAWHLRDIAWDQGLTGAVNNVHFDWKPQARQLAERKKWTLSPKVLELANSRDQQAFREIKCRRMILRADEYDLPAAQTRGKPWVSVYVDCENETIMEEIALRTKPVTISRWATGGTMYGKQYAYSPAAIYALPDGRMLQQIVLSMLTSAEMANFPPLIAVGESINGAVNLYAGGITQADADYDERTGEVLRSLDLRFDGIKYGAEQLDRLERNLQKTWYLDKIKFPEITKDMTAYEASKLWDNFISGALPLFEPVEIEFNAAICEGTFEDMMDRGAFGPVRDMPAILRGRDINWQFDTPITVAAEKALVGAFQAFVQTLVEGAQVDPDVVLNADMNTATREALGGTGSPAKWLYSTDKVKQLQAQKQQEKAAAAAAQQVATGADVATRVGNAAQSAGDAAQSLQGAGVL